MSVRAKNPPGFLARFPGDTGDMARRTGSTADRLGNELEQDDSGDQTERKGKLQAALILREYKECYDALVSELERGASLGECIFAIEKAAKDYCKAPLQQPLGYLVEHPGEHEEWIPTDSEKAGAGGAAYAN